VAFVQDKPVKNQAITHQAEDPVPLSSSAGSSLTGSERATIHQAEEPVPLSSLVGRSRVVGVIVGVIVSKESI